MSEYLKAQSVYSSQGIGPMKQNEYQSSIPPSPSAPGIVEMTSAAHQAFESLSQTIGDLISKVGPLIEPYPEPGCSVGAQDHACEASAITGLRLLIERIVDKTAEIQRLTAALRV